MEYRYRSRIDRVIFAIVAPLFALIVLGGFSSGAWEGALFLGIVFCVLGYRTWGLRVTMSDDDVTIHNTFRTYRVRLDEIDRFELSTVAARGRTFPNTGIAVLRDGREIPMLGIGAARGSGEGERAGVKAVVEALGADLATRRQAKAPSNHF